MTENTNANEEFNAQSDEETKFDTDKAALEKLWAGTSLCNQISQWNNVKGDRFEFIVQDLQTMRDIESETPYKAPVLIQKVALKIQDKKEPTPLLEEVSISFKMDADGDAHVTVTTTGIAPKVAFEGHGLNKANKALQGWIVDIQETYELESAVDNAITKQMAKQTKAASKPSVEGR